MVTEMLLVTRKNLLHLGTLNDGEQANGYFSLQATTHEHAVEVSPFASAGF